ncbi:MAG: histidine phosphatase family protein [Actinomycetota bacterium]
MRRLLLVRHAATGATRVGAFGRDEGLDPRGRDAAAALAGRRPRRRQVVVSPARAARETAAAAGLAVDRVDAALADCDAGAWAGRSLRDVHRDDPLGAVAWLTDPDAAPHGGESLRAVLDRVAGWLTGLAGGDGAVVAVTHAAPIRAALVHALGAPAAALWRIDVAPLSITELHASGGGWTVARVNAR